MLALSSSVVVVVIGGSGCNGGGGGGGERCVGPNLGGFALHGTRFLQIQQHPDHTKNSPERGRGGGAKNCTSRYKGIVK